MSAAARDAAAQHGREMAAAGHPSYPAQGHLRDSATGRCAAAALARPRRDHLVAFALQLAAAFAPDAALLDIGLPDMDGFERALCLRDVPKLQNILGFEHHFAKPVELPSLLRALRGMLTS